MRHAASEAEQNASQDGQSAANLRQSYQVGENDWPVMAGGKLLRVRDLRRLQTECRFRDKGTPARWRFEE